MILRDYHMHTNRCDAANTAEEMILAAIEKGLVEVGISEHSYTAFDPTYCLSLEATKEYVAEMKALKEKYADRISVKIGLEFDRYSTSPLLGIEYTIGSVHYVKLPLDGSDPASVSDTDPSRPGTRDTSLPDAVFSYGGELYFSIDESGSSQQVVVDRYYGGDFIAFAEDYFDTVAEVVEATGCDIIGHFDLVAKFNEKENLFDEEDPRYIAAWKKAVDRLIPYGVPFEINTGAISKGYRSKPYPSDAIRDHIREKGGRFILSSDSHRTDTLCYRFEEYKEKQVQEGSVW